MSIPVYKKQQIRKAFEKMEAGQSSNNKTGFVMKHSGEINALFYHKGVFILRSAVPGGRGDIPTGTQRAIRGQLNLNQSDFVDFAECPMDLSGYIESLKEAKLIEEDDG